MFSMKTKMVLFDKIHRFWLNCRRQKARIGCYQTGERVQNIGGILNIGAVMFDWAMILI